MLDIVSTKMDPSWQPHAYPRATPCGHTERVPDPHPYLAPPAPRAFAHRGWHIADLAGMENSLSAFRRAAHEGYSYVETDVQVTSDGVVVVHPAAPHARPTDGSGIGGGLPIAAVRPA
jgi:glycerophosphoryl diester phosphodiesterase